MNDRLVAVYALTLKRWHVEDVAVLRNATHWKQIDAFCLVYRLALDAGFIRNDGVIIDPEELQSACDLIISEGALNE